MWGEWKDARRFLVRRKEKLHRREPLSQGDRVEGLLEKLLQVAD
jgi:hypothetical protein